MRLVLKHKEKPEFECICFDFENGAMCFYMPFNKETAMVPDMTEQDPIAWVWLANSDDLIIKDRRAVKYISDEEEYKKLKQYNSFVVKQDGSKSVFFEKLADLGALRES